MPYKLKVLFVSINYHICFLAFIITLPLNTRFLFTATRLFVLKAVVLIKGSGNQFRTFRKTPKDNQMTKSGECPATLADATAPLNETD